jgi:hypothetical protein
VELLPLQTNKNLFLYNFRVFSCKIGVSDNLDQVIICLETWLRTHEKNVNKKTIKQKNS